jgi:hypothetical protein
MFYIDKMQYQVDFFHRHHRHNERYYFIFSHLDINSIDTEVLTTADVIMLT